jgi:hypothetical protein
MMLLIACVAALVGFLAIAIYGLFDTTRELRRIARAMSDKGSTDG